MKVYHLLVVLLGTSINLISSVWGIEIGDTVCVEGFIMDTYCIDNETLLDNNKIKTLEGPGEHSVHCLVDVSVCIDSAFNVLKEPDEDTGGLYTIAYQVDDDGKNILIELARDVGEMGRWPACSTCRAETGLLKGFRAEVTGVVTDLGDGTIDNPSKLMLISATPSNGRTDFCSATQQQLTDIPTISPTNEPTLINVVTTSEPTNAQSEVVTEEPTIFPTSELTIGDPTFMPTDELEVDTDEPTDSPTDNDESDADEPDLDEPTVSPTSSDTEEQPTADTTTITSMPTFEIEGETDEPTISTSLLDPTLGPPVSDTEIPTANPSAMAGSNFSLPTTTPTIVMGNLTNMTMVEIPNVTISPTPLLTLQPTSSPMVTTAGISPAPTLMRQGVTTVAPTAILTSAVGKIFTATGVLCQLAFASLFIV